MMEHTRDSVRLHLTPEQQREIQRVTGKYLTILEMSFEEFERLARPPGSGPAGGADPAGGPAGASG